MWSNNMKYKIEGITCNACKKIIEMDLEDAGFSTCVVDVEQKCIEIPDALAQQVKEIADVIHDAGVYTMSKEAS